MLYDDFREDSHGFKALYVHIPFCNRICPFCSFVVRRDRPALHKAYLAGLLAELRMLIQTGEDSFAPLESIYIGGGTPSRLLLDEVGLLIEEIKKIRHLKDNAEISFEANPEDLSVDYLNGLKIIAINRVSLGGQSFQDSVLMRLGRIHSGKELRDAVRCLKSAGLQNWNLDLMFGIPEQSFAQFQADLDEALLYSPTHISLYGLEVHRHTPFGHDPTVRAWVDNRTDLFARMYLHAVEFLEKNGFRQYEISNFARRGCEGLNNLLVWQGNPYLGIGVGAHSYDGQTRWGNIRSVRTYLNCLKQGTFPVAFREQLTPRQKASETLMLALRQPAGLDLVALSARYALEGMGSHDAWLHCLQQEGKCVWDPPCLKLTPKGMLLADAITSRLMPASA